MPKFMILTGEKYLVEAQTEEEAISIFEDANTDNKKITYIEADTWSAEC